MRLDMSSNVVGAIAIVCLAVLVGMLIVVGFGNDRAIVLARITHGYEQHAAIGTSSLVWVKVQPVAEPRPAVPEP